MKYQGEIRERHFFLEKGQKNIYCVEYLPTQKKINHGVIFCKSIWGERNRTHKIFTNLSRELAKKGITVVTCDYYGDGNSGGDTLDMSFSEMVEDILSMHSYLQNQYNLTDISMVGFRIGANCAIAAQKKMGKIISLILIEPEKDLTAFLTKKLRSNISNQMAVHKKIIKNREALIKDIKNGQPVNMDGSLLGKRLWESFEEVGPINEIPKNYRSMLILSLLERGKKLKKDQDYRFLIDSHDNSKTEVIEKEFIWHDWKSNIQYPPIFIERIITELSSITVNRES